VAVNESDKAESIETPQKDTALAGCRESQTLLGKGADVTLDGDKVRVNVEAKQVLVIAVR
jgi:hypothetical protein